MQLVPGFTAHLSLPRLPGSTARGVSIHLGRVYSDSHIFGKRVGHKQIASALMPPTRGGGLGNSGCSCIRYDANGKCTLKICGPGSGSCNGVECPEGWTCVKGQCRGPVINNRSQCPNVPPGNLNSCPISEYCCLENYNGSTTFPCALQGCYADKRQCPTTCTYA